MTANGKYKTLHWFGPGISLARVCDVSYTEVKRCSAFPFPYNKENSLKANFKVIILGSRERTETINVIEAVSSSPGRKLYSMQFNHIITF